MSYVELHARSAFSFLRGASPPEKLVAVSAALEIPALAVSDRDGVYGTARVHAAAREAGIRPLVGAELSMEDGSVIPVLVKSREGYSNLCKLITRAKLRGTKEAAPIFWSDLPEFTPGLVALTGDEEGPIRMALHSQETDAAVHAIQRLVQSFGSENVYIEIQRHFDRGETRLNQRLVELARQAKLPLLATGGVLHATPEERKILDIFTCARHHTHLDAAGKLLSKNAERHLKTPTQMKSLFSDLPEAVLNSVRLAERLEFTLENLGYEFPRYPVPSEETMDTFLHKVTMAGARARYSHLSKKVSDQLRLELALIAKLGFSGYFLIVWDLVNFCTENQTMVQGRGSAANSVVCYSLGITACDPIACNLLFERFLSEGRTSWPDIDLDLPSGERRERVIQEVYRRYGQRGAAMTANVITYRGRSAMREIGKALNFPLETLNRFSHFFASGDFPHTMAPAEQLHRSGLDIENPRTLSALTLYSQIYGLPRHLGQHSGGMIICQGQLDSIVPLERASMEGRVVAQWDKDDCEDLGIIKVDLLGLGMMAVMQESLELCATRGRAVDLAAIPKDDPKTYDLMCAADTIGVFQIESRAQMATLPRMKPRCFYDVVVEVAIIRPGPIQGDMLHPYLARREGNEDVTYFEERLKPVLERTLGIPLFQEQLLKMAMVMGDFSGSEAEELRRALSFHRSPERMNKICNKLRIAMAKNGTPQPVIDSSVKAIESFAVYGFPESHAISFAILAYASCWLKVHRAEEFYVSLLNNQPMGFYSPASLVADAKRRGLRVKPVSVFESEWLCTVEAEGILRLGLCYVRDLRQEEGKKIVIERNLISFVSLTDFQLRTTLSKNALRSLAKIGALNGLAEHRRAAQWEVELDRQVDDLFAKVDGSEIQPLAQMLPEERMQADYSGTGLSVGPHPMKLLRSKLPGIWRASDLKEAKNGTRVRIAGQVICRQRPGTAKGFVFVSLEDETGVSNAIVMPRLFERYRLLITEEPFLVIEGDLQIHSNVIHIKAIKISSFPASQLDLPASHDFR